jgi:hypothetical protein
LLGLHVHHHRDAGRTLLAQRALDILAVDRLPFEEQRNDLLEGITA